MSDSDEFRACPCDHCGQKLEFPAEGVGAEVQCPTCGKVTRLHRPASAPIPSPIYPVRGKPALGAAANALSEPLSSQNKIVYRAVPSSAPLYIALGIIGFPCVGIVTLFSFHTEERMGFVVGFILVFALLVAVLIIGKMAIKATEVVLTDHRVILSWGVINKRTVETFLDKVEGIDVVQSIVGRIFNYGSVAVRGTGGGGTPCPGIRNPHEFRRIVIEQIQNRKSTS